MDHQGNFDDLAALEDFANDTHEYASDDELDDDRCSYDEDLDPGHIDVEMNTAKRTELESMLGSNRENGDGQEHLESKWK